MRTTVMAWGLAACIALSAVGADAPGGAAGEAGDRVRTEGALVNLQFDNQPLSAVTDHLARQAGITVVPSPDLAGRKISVLIIALDWRKALRLVAEQVGGYVDEMGPNVFRITNPPRVTYTTLTEGNDIKEVLTVIAEYAGANIVVADTVKGRVNLRLKDVPWKHAIQQAVKAAGDYAVVEEDFNLIRVIPSSSLRTQVETRIFNLKFVSAPSNYKATLRTNYALARDYTSGGKAKELKPAIEDFLLYKALKNVLTPDLGKLEYDGTTNVFLATDIKPRLDEMQRIIDTLDVEPVQILVDVKFVTTTNADLFDLGVDWGGANNTGSTISMTGGAMLHRLPFNLGHGGFEDSIGLSTNGGLGSTHGTVEGPNDSDLPSSGRFSFGTLDFTTVQAVMRFFKRDSETKIVQRPSLFTLDNQEATIFVGDTIRYAQTEASSSSNGSLVFTLKEVDTPVRTGFQLYFVPHVIPGTNKIMMTLIPESNTLSGTGTTITGFDHYTNGTQSIDLPRITSRTLVTKMLLEDGQTAIVGGLLQENASRGVNKFPVLGDIPILGWFFKSERSNKTQENLVVFITPRIVRSGEQTQQNLARELEKRDAILKGEFTGGLEPEAAPAAGDEPKGK